MTNAGRGPEPVEGLGTEADHAAARDATRGRREAPWRRPGALAAAGAVAVLVAVLVVAAPLAPGGGGTALAAMRLPDGEVVEIERAFDRAQLDGLQAELARHGVVLHVEEVPVDPRADGRVYDVAFPPSARLDGEGRLLVDEGGLPEPVVVTVGTGSAEQRGTSAGLTLYETFPELCDAIDVDDPRATGRGLRRLGFRVRWVLVDHAGGDVRVPPPGTAVLSVLGPGGELTDVPRDARELMVEVAPRGSAILRGHGAIRSCR